MPNQELTRPVIYTTAEDATQLEKSYPQTC